MLLWEIRVGNSSSGALSSFRLELNILTTLENGVSDKTPFDDDWSFMRTQILLFMDLGLWGVVRCRPSTTDRMWLLWMRVWDLVTNGCTAAGEVIYLTSPVLQFV